MAESSRRTADLLSREHDLILWAYAQSPDKLWFAHGPVARLPLPVSDMELASAVQTVLDGSVVGVPLPHDGPNLKHVLAAAGATSERALYKGARSVGLNAEPDGRLIVTPMRPFARGWSNNGEGMTLDRPSPAEIASGVRAAIELAKPRA